MDDRPMNHCLLYAGTEDGLRTFRVTGTVTIEQYADGLSGNTVRAIATHPDDSMTVYVGCGLRGWGLHYTDDGGMSFTSVGFEDEWVWDVTFDPSDSRTVYVGTEPPMVYVAHDGDTIFDQLEAIEALPSRPEWTFFHEPFHAGHVHGLSIHPDRPDQIVAGVEHGALVYSLDSGRSWDEALVGYDIHRTSIDPADPDRWFAGAGEGLFISRDAGTTWTAIDALVGKYVHSIRFDPHHSGRLFVYADAAPSPVYRSPDRGETWQAIGDGLPTAKPADPLCLHPDQANTLFYAGDVTDSRSRLFVSTDGGTSWEDSSRTIPKVWRLEAAAIGREITL